MGLFESKEKKATAKDEGSDSIEIVKQDISLPDGQKQLAFILHNVFTEKECQALIDDSERRGYGKALLGVSQKYVEDIRNNDRSMWDSTEQADVIWQRIKPYIPPTWQEHKHTWKVKGLNERLRFLRYDAGMYFKPHMDGQYVRNDREKSFITTQLYLNQDFDGGATTFLSNYHHHYEQMDETNDNVPCIPKAGMVLVFEHRIMHEGSMLNSGRKYAIRTDVMYEKTE